MSTVKFAVVGLGNIGSRHLAVLDAHPDARIVSICDVDASKTEKYLKLYGDATGYTRYDEMLQKTDADIINICTPHYLHAPMSIEAANRSKHILVEKPMALNKQEARDMINAAERNSVKLMVVKQNRYNIPVIHAKKVLDDGGLGRVLMVQCNVLWNRNPEYYSESDWRGRKDLEGGSLFTQVSHFIDLMIWLFGDVVEASSQIATRCHNVEIEDCGTAWVEFSSGVMGSIIWTTCVFNKNFEGSITIVGEKGTIKIGGQYLNQIEFWNVKDIPLLNTIQFVDKPNSYGKYQGTSSNHDKVINEVINEILFGNKRTVHGDEGIKTVEAINLIYGNSRGMKR